MPDTAFFAPEQRHRLVLAAEVHDRGERIGEFIIGNVDAMGVGKVDLQPREQDPVELGSVSDARVLVEPNRIIEVVQNAASHRVTSLQLGARIGQPGLEPGSLIPDVPELLSDLGLREVRVGYGLDVAIFLVFEFGQSAPQQGLGLGVLTVSGLQRFVEQVDQALAQLR